MSTVTHTQETFLPADHLPKTTQDINHSTAGSSMTGNNLVVHLIVNYDTSKHQNDMQPWGEKEAARTDME